MNFKQKISLTLAIICNILPIIYLVCIAGERVLNPEIWGGYFSLFRFILLPNFILGLGSTIYFFFCTQKIELRILAIFLGILPVIYILMTILLNFI